jgi:hypothetical protein
LARHLTQIPDYGKLAVITRTKQRLLDVLMKRISDWPEQLRQSWLGDYEILLEFRTGVPSVGSGLQCFGDRLVV